MSERMKARLEQNMDMMRPEEMMKGWMALGGQAQEQFQRFMGAAAGAASPKK